jgi:hypothetical protein
MAAAIVMKMTVTSGKMAVFSPKTLAHVSRYEFPPTAAPTRAIDENVYAETMPVGSRIANAGSSATLELEKAATPAASASTPEPTIFLERLMMAAVTLTPAGGWAAAAVSDVVVLNR